MAWQESDKKDREHQEELARHQALLATSSEADKLTKDEDYKSSSAPATVDNDLDVKAKAASSTASVGSEQTEGDDPIMREGADQEWVHLTIIARQELEEQAIMEMD